MNTRVCAQQTQNKVRAGINNECRAKIESADLRSVYPGATDWPQAGSWRRWGSLCSRVTASPPTRPQLSAPRSESQHWRNAAAHKQRSTCVTQAGFRFKACKYYKWTAFDDSLCRPAGTFSRKQTKAKKVKWWCIYLLADCFMCVTVKQKPGCFFLAKQPQTHWLYKSKCVHCWHSLKQ